MEITKLEHACMILREAGETIVIDPGNYTRPVAADCVAAVVITHEHPDHVVPEQLGPLLAANPGATVFGPQGVADSLSETMPDIRVDVVADGELRRVGPFSLRFVGTRHELIHRTVPIVDNTGVMVNDAFFYPGDAYTPPRAPVRLMAAPVGAPWLRVGDMMDYVHAVGPERVFPVHEGTLSDAGFAQATMRLRQAAEPRGRAVILQPGEAIEV